MRLATIRVPGGTRAVRLDEQQAVETGEPDVGILLTRPDWHTHAAAAAGRPHSLDGLDWLHAIDLATKASCAELPPALIDTLLDDVTASFTTRSDCPPLRLAATDRDQLWRIGNQAQAVDMCGSAAALVG